MMIKHPHSAATVQCLGTSTVMVHHQAGLLLHLSPHLLIGVVPILSVVIPMRAGLTWPMSMVRVFITVKVGLIGCGGRGTGAANQALHAADYAELTAVGEVDQLARVEDAAGQALQVRRGGIVAGQP